MGCASSDLSESDQKSRQLDRKLRDDNRRAAAVMKLLLLGAGESGKSMMYKALIHANVINFMKNLCGAVESLGLGHLTGDAAKKGISAVFEMGDQTNLGDGNQERTATLRALWADESIQAAWKRRSEFFIIETHGYFFEPGRLEAICASDYDPTEADILRVRARTSGVIEKRFNMEGNQFAIIDVGGQKSERRKWLSCFDDVHGVIFVAALSEYDQTLFEDEQQNRMQDALDLFKKLCNDAVFDNTAFILFLNKMDLFKQKIADPTKQIKSVPLFADYSGPPSDYAAGVSYFRGKFESMNKTKKDIYVHETCATDTTLIKKVLGDCKTVVLKAALQESGFIA